MKEKFGYIPKDNRKKILLLCDDIRLHSGVATIARELVINTAHHFNWANLGGAINHPEQGKRLDISADTNTFAGIDDSSIVIYPTSGYGSPDLIRQLMEIEKPDALFLITDPRYWTWLFQIENEIRRKVPIVYLNIWDDYPAPQYNRAFYESCDALLAISKQTLNINKLVLGQRVRNKVMKYVPHGCDHKIFRPLTSEDASYKEYKEFIDAKVGSKERKFVVFFNSRNIRRKSVPDLMLAYKLFLDRLSVEDQKKCLLLLHTQPVDENGTDLPAVQELLFKPEQEVIYSNERLTSEQLNYLYNYADVTCLLSSNEGWGLALTESMLAGTMILANVTGGMQDQMRFSKDGKWIDFDADFPSNHRGTVKEHGEWAIPVFPSNISMVGSVPTPYIFDDRCRPEDVAEELFNLFQLPREERKRKGLEGRAWATSEEASLTSELMSVKVVEALEELFTTWIPREKFEFIKIQEREPNYINHKLLYQ
jgi:glycosyltransferase involved in cell wall biosynthesis